MWPRPPSGEREGEGIAIVSVCLSECMNMWFPRDNLKGLKLRSPNFIHMMIKSTHHDALTILVPKGKGRGHMARKLVGVGWSL